MEHSACQGCRRCMVYQQLNRESHAGTGRLRPADRQPHSDPMSLSDIASVATDHPSSRIFEGLPRLVRHSILATASMVRFSADSVVTNQGDLADRFFLLVKGCARYFFLTPDGRKVYLLWLAPGEIFGGSSMLTKPSLFLVSTEVVKNSRVLVWPRDTIRKLAEQFPRLLDNGLAIATDYLTWYLASHLSLVCETSRQRLAHVVVSLANGLGKHCSAGVCLDVTNEQLANTANITLFTVSRLLSRWHREGVIIKTRGKIIVRSQDRLLLSKSS